MNPHQVSRIRLLPDVVDCIDFWTKNPANMIERLDELQDYKFYFQFTLTGYGRDIVPNLPNKRNNLIPTFKRLSEKIGSDRVIWWYDPILITDKYTLIETCAEQIELGTYHTCKNGCKYCYANFSDFKVAESVKLYDVNSPLLCAVIRPEDINYRQKDEIFKNRTWLLIRTLRNQEPCSSFY
ncbi:MAG: DUF1848 domain-containing protein [Clostridiales bacterium]|nr:DUF1848 domain-containing protein [Clostridiales bacterium]